MGDEQDQVNSGNSAMASAGSTRRLMELSPMPARLLNRAAGWRPIDLQWNGRARRRGALYRAGSGQGPDVAPASASCSESMLHWYTRRPDRECNSHAFFRCGWPVSCVPRGGHRQSRKDPLHRHVAPWPYREMAFVFSGLLPWVGGYLAGHGRLWRSSRTGWRCDLRRPAPDSIGLWLNRLSTENLLLGPGMGRRAGARRRCGGRHLFHRTTSLPPGRSFS